MENKEEVKEVVGVLSEHALNFYLKEGWALVDYKLVNGMRRYLIARKKKS